MPFRQRSSGWGLFAAVYNSEHVVNASAQAASRAEALMVRAATSGAPFLVDTLARRWRSNPLERMLVCYSLSASTV